MDFTSNISIVLPFKNEARYIAACLDSILSQTHVAWEVIAVDDHSTDSSPAIVKAYSRRDSRIRYILNSGSGVIDALAYGMDNSKGNFITRMDADDIKHPENLSSLRSVWRKGGIAIGLVKYFREGGLGDGYQQYESWINEVNSNGHTWREVYRECVIPSPCWLVHREDMVAVGGFRSKYYPEDYDLCFRFYRQGLRPACTHNVIHYWRDHEIRTTRVSDHYSDNQFTMLKMHYFLELDHKPDKDLVLFGAGNKAKKVAKILCESNVPFRWLTNNRKKLGHNIYGVVVESNEHYIPGQGDQVLVAITNFSWPFDPSNVAQPDAEVYYLC